jgi:hypothetical protein
MIPGFRSETVTVKGARSDSGHFLPEEQPDAVMKHILSMAVKTAKAA